jgi:hypothetical protein
MTLFTTAVCTVIVGGAFTHRHVHGLALAPLALVLAMPLVVWLWLWALWVPVVALVAIFAGLKQHRHFRLLVKELGRLSPALTKSLRVCGGAILSECACG